IRRTPAAVVDDERDGSNKFTYHGGARRRVRHVEMPQLLGGTRARVLPGVRSAPHPPGGPVGRPLLPRVVRRVRGPPHEIQDRAHVARSADTWLVDRGVSRRPMAALPHAAQGVPGLRGALFPVGAPGGSAPCLIYRFRPIGYGRQTGFGARRRRRSGPAAVQRALRRARAIGIYDCTSLGAVAIVFAAMLQWLFR